MSISYRTKDLNEASFLWCQDGTKLTAIEPAVAGRVPEQSGRPETFFFRFTLEFSDAEFHTLMLDYANEDTSVEPQTFVRKQNNLRDRLYAVKKQFPRGSRT